jgi:hypothetical protein
MVANLLPAMLSCSCLLLHSVARERERERETLKREGMKNVSVDQTRQQRLSCAEKRSNDAFSE